MKRLVAFMASLVYLLASCDQIEQERPSETVDVSLSYTITSYEGGSMYLTKSENSDIFAEFYAKIVDGSLIAPSYDVIMTNETNNTEYHLSGTWAENKVFEVKKGTYTISGTATASGNHIQEKCSIVFNDKVVIDGSTSVIKAKAQYDASLIIFRDKTIESITNFDGNDETQDLFEFNEYIYAFVNDKLYDEENKNLAYFTEVDNNGNTNKTLTGNIKLEKGKYYIFDSIYSLPFIFDIPEMEDGTTSDDSDLSKNGTANCYIVPKAGQYSFNASVQGNSTTSVGSPVKAEVIWETFNTSETPNIGDIINEVKLENGRVSFNATGKCGNALVAVKDVNNVILWSWHLWCTDYDPSTNYDTYYGKENIKVMDRNLGAMSSEAGTSAIGFIYEWGRKDPFMDQSIVSTSSAFDEEVSSSTCGTIEYAIQNPTTYICATSQGYDWLQSSDSNLWSSTKTKYDPCPVGYKVPEGGADGLWVGLTDESVEWTYDSVNDGCWFTTSTSSIYLPMQGYHTDRSSGWWCAGTEGRYWSTTTYNNKYSDYLGVNSKGEITTYHPSGWGTHLSRANGQNVRCCAE